MKKLVVATSALMLAGCVGPNPNLGITNLAAMPAPMVRQVEAVRVTERTPSGAVVIGTYQGTSCKNKMWDPMPTEQDALEQLRIRAATAGGTGVSEVVYSEGGFSMATNCWSSITATGVAYR